MNLNPTQQPVRHHVENIEARDTENNKEAPFRLTLMDGDITTYQAVQSIINTHSKNWILEYYSDGRQIVEKFSFTNSAFVLMDIHIPNFSGIEFIAKLRCLRSDSMILIVTACSNQESVYLSLAAGASGYLLKPISSVKLESAIENLRKGSAVLCEEAQTAVLSLLHATFDVASSKIRVSTRERQIMLCLAQNLSDKEISIRLNIAPNTTHVYLVQLFQKLNAHNRSEAIQRFFGVCLSNSCCPFSKAGPQTLFRNQPTANL